MNTPKPVEENEPTIEHIGTTGKSIITHELPEVDCGIPTVEGVPDIPDTTMTYPATLEQIGHMRFVGHFRDLPGIEATGTDMEELRADAIAKLNDVLESHLLDGSVFHYPSSRLAHEYPLPVSQAIAVKMAEFTLRK